MKKMKKFDDGGLANGRFVMDGDSGRYVEDNPVPVAAGIGPRMNAPMGAGIGPMRGGPMGAGLAPVLSDTAGGFESNMDRFDSGVPSGIRQNLEPIGRMLPPMLRGQGSDGGRLDQSMSAGMAGMKKGGAVKKAKGGTVSSASKRGDGCAVKGKTKGRFV